MTININAKIFRKCLKLHDYKQNRYTKAEAFIDFCINEAERDYRSCGANAEEWGKSRATAGRWANDFREQLGQPSFKSNSQ